MRILHLHTEINLSCGISKTIYHLCKKSKAEFEHSVLTLNGDAVELFDENNIMIDLIPISKTKLNLFRIRKYISNYVEKNDIEIIHCHHRYFDFICSTINSPKIKSKITSVQSKVSGKRSFSYKSEKLIACSNSIKTHLINSFGISDNRISVIHNFVDPNEIIIVSDKNELKKKLGIDPAKKLIGYIGRINIEEKGIDNLVQIFNSINKKRNDVEFLIVGSGPDEEWLRSEINNSAFNIHIIPAQKDVYNYFNLLDLFIICSKIEPFGMVLVEAGLMNIPIVSSNVDGIPEVLGEMKKQISFSPDDIELATHIVSKHLDDKTFSDSTTKYMKNRILSYFTSEKIIPQYESLYKEKTN